MERFTGNEVSREHFDIVLCLFVCTGKTSVQKRWIPRKNVHLLFDVSEEFFFLFFFRDAVFFFLFFFRIVTRLVVSSLQPPLLQPLTQRSNRKKKKTHRQKNKIARNPKQIFTRFQKGRGLQTHPSGHEGGAGSGRGGRAAHGEASVRDVGRQAQLRLRR